MATYKQYMAYLNSMGLESATHYNYRDKSRNIAFEINRMINRSLMMFKWHELPDTIPWEELELILQMQGYAIVGMINGRLYACYGGLGGKEDEYNRPTLATVSVPYLNYSATWEIGSDCVIIRNDMMCQGLIPLYAKYAAYEEESNITLMMELVNMRAQSHIVASDDKAIKSAETYINNLYDGKLGVIADNIMFDNVRIFDRKNNDNLKRIQEIMQYIKGSLYNEIGLATNYNIKRERVSQAEVELNTDSLYPMVDNMYRMRLDGIDSVKALYDVDWKCEYNSSWDYRIFNGEPITTKGAENDSDTDTDGDGAVNGGVVITDGGTGDFTRVGGTDSDTDEDNSSSPVIDNGYDSSNDSNDNTGDSDITEIKKPGAEESETEETETEKSEDDDDNNS